MSRIFLGLLFSIISLYGVEFHSYTEALILQKKTKKIIMLDVVRTGCHFCEKMDTEVLQNSALSKLLEKYFIVARVNLDTELLPEGIKVDFTPTFYFFDYKHKIIKKIPGSWSLKDFKSLIEDMY